MRNDSDRLRAEYAERAHRLSGSDIYSRFNVANLFVIQNRQRMILRLLRKNGFYPLDERRVLEVGCGEGGELLEILSFGASPQNLHGIDLLFDRVQTAHHMLTNLPLINADGQNLPYFTDKFDLIIQFTVFSCILSDEIKANVAREMMRVTRPGGAILWYDFWLNPINPQTRGIRPAEIRRLFPNCTFEFHKITLAPPLARRLVPISWGLALFLEGLGIFNTHYLVMISPKIESNL